MSVTGVDKIHVLPGEVVSRIAAGEVVERPAAVVKELIDNSLDAASASITVEVTEGGRSLIRVADDGEGMSRTDAELAFQRHATSKVRSERDLWSIRTMGFRGEALPSIASVSKVRLVTASRQGPVGTQVQITGGTITKIQEAAAAPGTHVEVADLFFNTPARRKFLKTTATEFSHICQVMQQAALAWPGVQFRLSHNGQEVFEYPAVASRRDRILQLYGSRLLGQMIEVRGERPSVRLEGFTVDPVHVRTGRIPQDLFVNHRPVKNATVQHAIYEAYGPALAKGRHPVFVLSLDVDPTRVDVNVHPMKREVRFADQDLIHQTVRQAILEAVGGGRKIESQGLHSGPTEPQPVQWSPGSRVFGDPAGGWSRPAEATVRACSSEPSHAQVIGEGLQPYLLGPSREVIPFGQVEQTFLVAQVGVELQVVDQHTAHERVLFERLCRAWKDQAMVSQPLLIPEPIDLPPHAAVLVRRSLPDLEKLGVQVEPFGSHSFVIRAVPALIGHLDHTSWLQDLAEEMGQWTAASSLEGRMRPVFASLACHGAVRAGRAMKLPEIKVLIEEWVGEGLPATCPHGRRIALRLPSDELQKIFGRTA